MGNKVSRVYGSLVRRPLQRFNAEHRAEKKITEFSDPSASAVRAPMYKADAELLEKLREFKPELAESQVKKDPELHSRLRDVYVTSEGEDPRQPERPDRPLPRDVQPYSQDFIPAQLRLDPKRKLTRGKVSLEQAVDFITKHSETKKEFGSKEIADQYRINPETVENTLRYCFTFSLMETETRSSEIVKPDPLQAGEDWQERVKPDIVKLFEEDKKLKQKYEDANLKADKNRRTLPEPMDKS